jgi:hypothetical protein
MPDKKPCRHAFLIRQIDQTNPTGGFTGDWECVRCKQRFKAITPRDEPAASFHRTIYVNMTAYPFVESVYDDDH